MLRHRVRVQQLDRAPGAARAPTDVVTLDLGVQDTGPDGSLWALAVRGADVTSQHWPDDLALAWTLRGAPHAYRRHDLPAVQRAVRPYSDADAGKRLLNATTPLRAAGIDPTDALAHVARTMRRVVTHPLDKGSLSTRMTAELTEPYLRWCGPCHATHMYEMPFRLAALHAGLELEPGTSPPVVRRAPGFPTAQVAVVARSDDDRDDGPFDLVRLVLHLLGPLTPKQVASFLDAPVKDVAARWPADVVPVAVADVGTADLLADDVEALDAAADADGPPAVRLVGPYDLFLQARDRTLLVPDAARHKALWPVLGRPGAVLVDGEVAGTWRPRATGGRLALELDEWVPWDAATRRAVAAEHERLAAFRGAAPA
ncbi:hypothetical protein Cch01nite_26140 [Cellulomonas chitinilytica]|uniref:Winged helix DNA-binding domain-containing protein n=1 Tax=Cellulomonas chitinilytica TaxID=398759 RepID=A0A919TZL3_9CELL|nr:hypothetical protein Cch01nite_26140 [Cellulomonas chitinilytica]